MVYFRHKLQHTHHMMKVSPRGLGAGEMISKCVLFRCKKITFVFVVVFCLLLEKENYSVEPLLVVQFR